MELVLEASGLYRALPIQTDSVLNPETIRMLQVLADAYGLSAYDAASPELAQRRGLELATLHRRLAQAAREAGVHLVPLQPSVDGEMRWLVDGYNVIRRDADLRAHESQSLEAGRTALLRFVAQAARAGGDRFTVVFDGVPDSRPAPAGGQVEVTFSRPPDTADDVLVRLARQLGAGAAVVTSDRAVRDAAGRIGCAVVSAEQFLDALSAESDEDDHADLATTKRPGKRGNPRRLSKEARAARRALRRLRPS